MIYVYHALNTRPRSWSQVAQVLQENAPALLAKRGGHLHGLFRNQIGRPRDEVSAITAWPDEHNYDAERDWFACAAPDILSVDSRPMVPTLRPTQLASPSRQGNFAFRWFETPEQNYAEFLQLCEAAWPDFESSYDSQVLGLWRFDNTPAEAAGTIHTLLLTRRPNLAMWERSKIPTGEVEVALRQKLTRRYELCDATSVFTTTLITASDEVDTVRWT